MSPLWIVILTVSIVLTVGLMVVLFYLVYNLYRKNEIYEDYIEELDQTTNMILTRLNQIDEKGTFKADDEVGFFFSSLKGLVSELERFKAARR